MTTGITNNKEGSIVGSNPQVLKGIMANLSLEDEFPAVSPLSNQVPIEENKVSHLDRSYELSEQKVKELNDLFTEVDRKPASKLTNLNYHLAQIALQTHFVNADVNSFVAMAESDIHVLPKKKQALVRKRIAEVKESAANMNAGVNMYDRIVNTIKAMSDNNMKPTGEVAMKYTKFNTAVSNFIADMNKLTKNEGSNVVINRFKVEQQLRQLMRDYSADQEAGILYTVDTAKQSKENEAIAIKKAEDLGLDPAKVVKQKGNKWLVTLDTSPLDKMLELLPAYKNESDKKEAERLLGMFSSDDYKENVKNAMQEGIINSTIYNSLVEMDLAGSMNIKAYYEFASWLHKNDPSFFKGAVLRENPKPYYNGNQYQYVSDAIENLDNYTHYRALTKKQRDAIDAYHANERAAIVFFMKDFLLEKINSGFDIESKKAEFFNEMISQELENKFPTVSMNGSQYNIFSSGFKIPETQVENTSSAVTRKAAGILTNIETLIQKLIQNLKSLYEIINSAFASIGR